MTSMWSSQSYCPFVKSKATPYDIAFFSSSLPIKDVPRSHDGPCDPRRVPAPLHGRQGRARHIFISYLHVNISAYFHIFIYQINLHTCMYACLHTFIYIKYICMDDKVGYTSPSYTPLSRYMSSYHPGWEHVENMEMFSFYPT